MTPSIPDSPTLSQLQEYQHAIGKARGWDATPIYQTWLLFTEEIGELAKAIRNKEKLYQESTNKSQPELEGEFADVLSYLLELANTCGVDLEQAYRDKEEVNAKRKWKS